MEELKVETTVKLETVFDFEKFQHLLKAHYCKGDVFKEFPEKHKRKLLEFIHNTIKEVLPEIFDNLLIKDDLPASVYGYIYYQVIIEDNRDAWRWEAWDININSLIWNEKEKLKKHLAESLLEVLKKVERELEYNRYKTEKEKRMKTLKKLREYLEKILNE